uniref:Fis family transcriptional regulator n=1 Tax=uncultured Thiotrichaceae bacterium TaxID=298394 RepID=A0A6S6SFQ7_9GAMM|nr:MAG: Fis family transcriptional regulator [uncultured Thiotrichaceae bacterium]
MQTHSIHVEYSEHFPDALQTTPDNFEQEARMAMAVKLLEMKRLTSGMAAQLAGIDRVSFLMTLSQYGVSIQDLTLKELESDFANT